MIRRALAAGLVCLAIDWHSAARALAQAAGPFPEVPVETVRPRAHTWAYLAMAAGALMIGGSFLLADRADDAYADYQAATDPDLIEELYDRTVAYDRLAQGSLLGGETLIVTGVYLRFIHRARPTRVGLELGTDRCAFAWRF